MNKYLSDAEFLSAFQTLIKDYSAPQGPAPISSQAVEPRPKPVKRAHIMIATPTTSGLKTSYVYALMHMVLETQRRNVGLGLSLMDGCSLIGAARNILVRKFLEDKRATHLLMVDDDISWKCDDVFRMLDSGYEFIVGAVPLRVINYEELEFHLKNGGSLEDAKRHVAKFNINLGDQGHRVKVDQNGFAEITYAGTAFMLVSREAVEKMIDAGVADEYVESGEKTWDLFGCIVDKEKRELNGEDVSFCKRWRSIGGHIHCLLDAELTHYGPVAVTGRFSDVLMDARSNQAA